MTQETAKAAKITLTVKVPDAVVDGKGGFLPVGAKVEPADAAAKASLIDKGFAA